MKTSPSYDFPNKILYLMGVEMNAKKIRMIIIIIIVGSFFPLISRAITPNEVFEDGRREFNLGHWKEAQANFARLIETWPQNSLAVKALYFRTLSELRDEMLPDEQEVKNRIASLTFIEKRLSESLSTDELLEIRMDLEKLRAKYYGENATKTAIIDLPPEKLLHSIRRGWITSPKLDPYGTLKWIREWHEKHPKGYVGQLGATLSLMQAKALWMFRISPLPTNAFSSILRTWGYWPLDKAIGRSLKAAFRDGDPDTKRDAALLGLCSDHLKNVQFSREGSEWMRYLRERGIHFSEAWCP